MTNGEKIKGLFPSFDVEDKTEYFGRIRNLDDHFIKADIEWWNAEYKEPTTKNDCEHCSKTYGTLGCCDFVSNEPVYSCKEGHEEYASGIRKLGTTTKNNLGVDCIDRTELLKAMDT